MYYRIKIEWARAERRRGLPNAVDVQLGFGDPNSAPSEIDRYIIQSCGVAPKAWSFHPITKAEYEADNVWVEVDGSSGVVV